MLFVPVNGGGFLWPGALHWGSVGLCCGSDPLIVDTLVGVGARSFLSLLGDLNHFSGAGVGLLLLGEARSAFPVLGVRPLPSPPGRGLKRSPSPPGRGLKCFPSAGVGLVPSPPGRGLKHFSGAGVGLLLLGEA